MAKRFLTNEDEQRFVKAVNGQTPDEAGNVIVQGGTVPDEKIAKAVEEYLQNNPVQGGLTITDDEAGNVTITSSGSVSITDDGNGNVVIA